MLEMSYQGLFRWQLSTFLESNFKSIPKSQYAHFKHIFDLFIKSWYNYPIDFKLFNIMMISWNSWVKLYNREQKVRASILIFWMMILKNINFDIIWHFVISEFFSFAFMNVVIQIFISFLFIFITKMKTKCILKYTSLSYYRLNLFSRS